MKVILLEKIRNLGNIGDTVNVKNGFARNFLVPQSKATVATKENLEKFAKIRAELEQKAAEQLALAQERAKTFEKLNITITMKSTEEGSLFGSVSNREVVDAIKNAGGEINRKEVILPKGPLRTIGEHEIFLQLHTDIMLPIKVTIVAETAE